MNIIISPGKLNGKIKCIADKSTLIRLIIAASLSDGTSIIRGFDPCDDVMSAIECCKLVGADFKLRAGELTVIGHGIKPSEEIKEYPCGQSGAVLRFMIPVVSAIYGGGDFLCEGQLALRPLGPYISSLGKHGISLEQNENRVTVRGRIHGGDYELTGDVSSQFFSGLCFALPICGGGSIKSTAKLQSAGYVDMTLAALRDAGICCKRSGDMITVQDGAYKSFVTSAEPSWSQAAFFAASNFLGSGIELSEMAVNSLQPDVKILEMLRLLRTPGNVKIDISQTPDLFPPVALCACVRSGKCMITNGERLRFKESNRLETVLDALLSLGAQIKVTGDNAEINGVNFLHGGAVDCRGDHRIAMLGAAASSASSGEILLKGAECVSKSYPGFFDDFRALGGVFREVG